MTNNRRIHYDLDMPIKVFIFEDHWMYREALTAVLARDRGIHIIGSEEDVETGLEKALDLKPHVVLMDIRFKGEDLGIQATAELHKHLPETKIIIFSEHPDEDYILRASDAGASGYILKSDVQDTDTILKAVFTVFQGAEYFTPSIKEKLKNKLLGKHKFSLTKREIEVLAEIGKGSSNREIAATLKIDERTVASHISNIFSKLYAKNRVDAVLIAKREKIIE